MPIPSLADANNTSSDGIARVSPSSSVTSTGLALGRSTLLITGTIFSPNSFARKVLANV